MIYLIITLVIVIVVFGPSLWVRWVMNHYSTERPEIPGTGAELAQHLIERVGLDGVTVEQTEPNGDHYSPTERVVRLSPMVHDGKSLSAIAIATHEVGHAIQHMNGDARLALRTRMAPTVQRLGQLSIVAISVAPVLGMLTRHPVPVSALVGMGLVGLLARVALHIVTLPTEFDASFGKALPILRAGQYVPEAELPAVRRILQAAALTYVAAALAEVLNLTRWLTLLLRR